MRVPALSVRAALLIVALVSIVPALAIIVATGFEHAAHLEQQAVLDAHRSVESMVGIQAQISESMRRMLATIASMRAFRTGDEGEQAEIVSDILRDNPELVNISVTDPSGFVTVSPGLLRGTDLSARRHIRDALATGQFVAGEFVTAYVDEVPSLPFAYPLRGAGGEITGAVAAVYPLSEFGELFDRLNLPTEAILGITDHRGVRLFFRPPKETNPVGMPIKAAIWEQMSAGAPVGTVVDRGSDNVERFYAYQRVFTQGSDLPFLYVVIGYPAAYARSEARRVLVRNLMLLLGMVVAAVLVARWLGGYVFGHRMEHLAHTAGQISDGDLDARTGIAERRTEVGRVAFAIDEMAAALAGRIRASALEQERIERSLREKEVLLKEIHHRVKNNLQLIMSIVHLQRRSATDLDAFCSSLEARIRAITGVHELLYQSSDLTTIPMQHLLEGLANVAAQAPGEPRVIVDAPEVYLPIERAIPIALIANELLTNSVKHAVPADGRLVISVKVKLCASALELTVADSGPGFAVERPHGGLGTQLVEALAGQLGGTIAYASYQGSEVTLRIPVSTQATLDS